MIGIFDSGDGGLPTLHAVRKILPQYDYLYLGDHARAPYGSRSQAEILEFTWQAVKYLFEQGCVLVILACNTASANALRRIQQERLPALREGLGLPETFPDRRVLGVLVPTVEQIAEGEGNTVLVLGTAATVKSGAYLTEVQKRNSHRRILQQACPDLVPLIEANAPSEKIHTALDRYLGSLSLSLSPGDVVMLGCTHFELIRELIAAHLPDGVKCYGQSAIVAKSLLTYLGRHPELEQRLTRGQSVHYFTTGDPQALSRAPFQSILLS